MISAIDWLIFIMFSCQKLECYDEGIDFAMNSEMLFITIAIVHWIIGIVILRKIVINNKRKWNPLDWDKIDRCLLLLITCLFVGGTFWFGVIQFNPHNIIWLDREWSKFFFNCLAVLSPGLIFLLCSGIWIRKVKWTTRIYTHTVVQYLAILSSLMVYSFGAVTNPSFLLFSVALSFVILLLFDLAVAISWLVTFVGLTAGSTIASGLGLIPYAPVFAQPPYNNGEIDSMYCVGTLIFSMGCYVFIFLILSVVVDRWRKRENQVVESRSQLSDMTNLLKKMFGRYLSNEVMSSLIENPSSLELGGEKRKVTIMMTDLRGFTALSERLEPEQVVQMLNAYFEVMIDIVLKYNGTVNEIIGDALLVIFGSPKKMPDRAHRAIACAIDMQNAMAIVNKKNLANNLPELEMGVGLNEAEVIVGNIGSSKRSKYSVVGSGVNITSRIESYTVGGQILISESVKQKAGEGIRIDGQKEMIPKGADAPMTIYEVGGIGGKYNLALDRKETAMVNLVRQIPLQYTVIAAKHVGKKEAKCRITRLSKKGCDIELNESVPTLTNLKMTLLDVDEDLGSKSFYGKVIQLPADNGYIHTIRFTAIPSEVRSYFQSHRQHGQI